VRGIRKKILGLSEMIVFKWMEEEKDRRQEEGGGKKDRGGPRVIQGGTYPPWILKNSVFR
jgi:hypothetical protein